jgi:hypothetical protein
MWEEMRQQNDISVWEKENDTKKEKKKEIKSLFLLLFVSLFPLVAGVASTYPLPFLFDTQVSIQTLPARKHEKLSSEKKKKALHLLFFSLQPCTALSCCRYTSHSKLPSTRPVVFFCERKRGVSGSDEKEKKKSRNKVLPMVGPFFVRVS